MLTQPIRSGISYPVTLTFARAGAIHLEVAAATPTTSTAECPLPAAVVPERTFPAQPGAPLPPTPAPPHCSTPH